jgi:hypothetical protein
VNKKAMIGCDCADGKFGVNERFKLESKRARYAMDRDGLISWLQFYWDNKHVMWQWLSVDTKRIANFQNSLKMIGNCLPRSTKDKCVDMQKTGRRTVAVELKYVEKDENGKEHIDWVSINAGVLHNTHLWAPGFLEGYRKRLFDARSTLLESLQCDDDTGNRQLSKWLRALDNYRPLITELDSFEDALETFCSMENMVTLYFMAQNREFRANIARAHFISRNEIPTNDKCQALVERIEVIVKSRTEGKDFRMAA